MVNSSRGINFAFSREPYASRFAPEEWEQAVKAAVFKAALYHLFDTRFRDCVVMVGGDPKKTNIGIEYLKAEVDDLLDEYSRLDEIEVHFTDGDDYEIS